MADLGAPTGLTEEEKKRLGLLPGGQPSLDQPEIFGQAVKASETMLGAPANEAERNRVFEYRAQPFLDAATKEKDLTNRYYESQGLRWSGGPSMRYNALNELEQKTWKNIGESVMIPQIEREQADKRANIALAAQVGGQQFQQALGARQQGVQERQMTLAETNSAMDRAVAQGQATGTFTDPVTGLSQETLAKQAQTFTQGQQERQTKLQETNSAMDRAVAQGQATGTFVDPVTGWSQETIAKKAQDLTEKVQKAIYTGMWDTGEVTLDARKIASELGLDPTTWAAVPPGTPPAPPPAGNGADDALADAKAETALITRLVPAIMSSKIPLTQMRTIFSGVDPQFQDAFLNWVQNGGAVPLTQLQTWFGSNQAALAALNDYVGGMNGQVWFKDRPPASGPEPPPPSSTPGSGDVRLGLKGPELESRLTSLRTAGYTDDHINQISWALESGQFAEADRLIQLYKPGQSSSDLGAQPPGGTGAQPPGGTGAQPPGGTGTQPPGGTGTQPPGLEADRPSGNPIGFVPGQTGQQTVGQGVFQTDLGVTPDADVELTALYRNDQTGLLGRISSQLFDGVTPAEFQALAKQATDSVRAGMILADYVRLDPDGKVRSVKASVQYPEDVTAAMGDQSRNLNVALEKGLTPPELYNFVRQTVGIGKMMNTVNLIRQYVRQDADGKYRWKGAPEPQLGGGQ